MDSRDAWFTVAIIAAVLFLGLAASEVLAAALQPVTEALMQGTEAVTVEVTP